ncbi:MAG: ThiF family adenylyltransferase [Candidatus Omnitrophica bacterium]|nr:ThiF family adenylyltransferase [Candidatus Omnitrophota bacterium]
MSQSNSSFSRYDRQIKIPQIGLEGQERIGVSCVAVVGLGALGSVSANLLARAGVGTLKLIDRDFLEKNNLQRQVLYDENDLDRHLPKAVLAEEKLKRVNSEIKINALASDLNAQTVDDLLEGVDVIVDGTDNFETRYLINDYALKHQIPWIYGGAVQTHGLVYVVLPGQGPCLRCLFPEAVPSHEAQTCDRSGILAPVSHLIASLQVAECLKILTGRNEAICRSLLKIDVWDSSFHSVDITPDDCPDPCSGCVSGDFPYLQRDQGTQTVKLCGRNAVQIHHWETRKIDFEALAAKLEGSGRVEYNDYIMNIEQPPYGITLFSNGRAIIKGTEDSGIARSLYAKYIGN